MIGKNRKRAKPVSLDEDVSDTVLCTEHVAPAFGEVAIRDAVEGDVLTERGGKDVQVPHLVEVDPDVVANLASIRRADVLEKRRPSDAQAVARVAHLTGANERGEELGRQAFVSGKLLALVGVLTDVTTGIAGIAVGTVGFRALHASHDVFPPCTDRDCDRRDLFICFASSSLTLFTIY